MEKKNVEYYETCRENLENDLRYFVSDTKVKEWIKSTKIPVVKENYKSILEKANNQMAEHAYAVYLELAKELNQVEEDLKTDFSSSINIESQAISNAFAGGTIGAVGAALFAGGPLMWIVAGTVGVFVGLFYNSNRMYKELINHILKNQNEIIRFYEEKCNKILSIIINSYSPNEKNEVILFADVIEELNSEQKRIKEFLESKNIKYLIHFTDFKNAESIQQNGVLSVQELTSQDKTFYRNDCNRFDNYLNYISLSISKPNMLLLNRFEKNESIKKPVYFFIDSSILYKEINTHRIYCQTNAATKNGKKGDTFADLENLFADKVQYFTSNGELRSIHRGKDLSDDVPTDSQAEILFEKRIDPKYFIKITDHLDFIHSLFIDQDDLPF